MTLKKRLYWIVALVALLALAAAAVTATPQLTSGGGAKRGDDANSPDGDGECEELITQPPLGDLASLPIAPDSERVDLCMPEFSNPTEITNPLFPISDLHSTVLLGTVDGLPFRTETTLLPDAKTITWNGERVETRVSQYHAYLDGRIHEVALDFYAQADDGSVWYFGEDVFNFEDGVVADMNGTWLAGKDGPAAMIMPADPQVGDVYRPENAPPFVFEQVTVKSVGVMVNGPQGRLGGAIIIEELHADGALEDKTFAPGYGEFLTGGGGEVEALALAVSTDALPSPVPAELQSMLAGALDVSDAAGAGDWVAASAALGDMTSDWTAFQASGDQPPLLEAAMNDALAALDSLVSAHDAAGTQNVALDTAQAALDFQLRHREPSEIDLARFDLWTRQVLPDVAAEESGSVAGDAATLTRIWARFGHTVDASDARSIDKELRDLDRAAQREDLDAAAAAATRLGEIIAGL